LLIDFSLEKKLIILVKFAAKLIKFDLNQVDKTIY